MKTIFDFAFSENAQPNLDVVWYSVKVGKSRRDAAAYRALNRRIKGDARFIFVQHCAEMITYINEWAYEVTAAPRQLKPVHIIPRAYVTISWLCSFLAKNPPQLLNSEKRALPLNCIDLELCGFSPALARLRAFQKTRTR